MGLMKRSLGISAFTFTYFIAVYYKQSWTEEEMDKKYLKSYGLEELKGFLA